MDPGHLADADGLPIRRRELDVARGVDPARAAHVLDVAVVGDRVGGRVGGREERLGLAKA